MAVIGDEELASGELTVTVRADSTPKSPAKIKMSPADLKAKVSAETAGKPWRRLPLSMLLSERPKFI